MLRQLMIDATALSRIAVSALDRCHFAADGVDQLPTCVAACYECLMSFGNQHESLRLDRHRIRSLLMELVGAVTLRQTDGRTWAEQLDWLRSRVDQRSPLESKLLDALAARHGRLPDAAQFGIAEPRPCPTFSTSLMSVFSATAGSTMPPG